MPLTSLIPQKYRNIGRIRHILAVFLGHGFGHFISQMGLHRFLPFGRRLKAAYATGRAPLEAAAMKTLDEYMDAWNRKDLEAWERTFHFPHYRLANGKMSVLEKPGQQDTARIWQAIPGWHHSRWDQPLSSG